MLTEKEKQVLGLRKRGLTQISIASKLKISQSAVSAFENNALRKIKQAKDTIDFAKEIGIKDKNE